MADLRPDHRGARVEAVRDAEQAQAVAPMAPPLVRPVAQSEFDFGAAYARTAGGRGSKAILGLSLNTRRQLTGAAQVQVGELLGIRALQVKFDALCEAVEQKLCAALPEEMAAAELELRHREQLRAAVDVLGRRLHERRKTMAAIKGAVDTIVKIAKVAGDQAVSEQLDRIELTGLEHFDAQMTGGSGELH
jgi:hypothetical protein